MEQKRFKIKFPLWVNKKQSKFMKWNVKIKLKHCYAL
jgi:hypothetical protein